MKTAKATKGQPEFDEEIRVPRFIWRVTRAWHPVKNDEEGLKILWAGQQKLLEALALQFPDQRQPALTVPPALPTLPALQARPAPPTEALTITPAISPPAGPAPIPISPAQFTNPSRTAKPTPAISPIPVSRGPVGLPPARPKPTQFEHSQLQPGTSAGTSAKPRVVAPPSRSPSLRYINRFAVLNRDEDADDADESPAPVNVDKGKGKEVVRGVKKPAPVNVDKGKGKEVVRGAKKPAPVNVDKGKGKEVVREAEKLPVVKVKRRKLANPKPALPWKTQGDVPEKTQGQAVPVPEKSQPDGEKKRPVPESSQIHRIPACKRCKRTKKNCVEQAGTGVACFGCAKLKMRCDPVSDDDEDDYDSRKPSLYPSGPSSQAIPAKRSAPDAVESSKPAKRPAQKKPAPKKKAAPVPASSQKNPPAKPRKPVKSPEYVHSTDEYEEDKARVAVQGEIRRPKGRTLADFEGYCGMFFFFYRKNK